MSVKRQQKYIQQSSFLQPSDLYRSTGCVRFWTKRRWFHPAVSSLTDLRIICNPNSAVSQQEINELINRLSRKQGLKCLSLTSSKNSLLTTGAQSLGQLISEQANTLEELSLEIGENNKIGELGAEGIFTGILKLSNLQRLSVKLDLSNNIGIGGVLSLGVSLKRLQQLSQLSLVFHDTVLNDRTVIALSEGIEFLNKLEHLELVFGSGNSLGRKGSQALGCALSKLSQLKVFALEIWSHCILSQDSFSLIADGLAYCEQIQGLKLVCMESSSIGEPGAFALGNTISHMKHLQQYLHIEFHQAQVNNAGLAKISDGIAKCHKLTDLTLILTKEQHIGIHGIQRFSQTLRQLRRLKKLRLQVNWSENMQECADALGEAFQSLDDNSMQSSCFRDLEITLPQTGNIINKCNNNITTNQHNNTGSISQSIDENNHSIQQKEKQDIEIRNYFAQIQNTMHEKIGNCSNNSNNHKNTLACNPSQQNINNHSNNNDRSVQKQSNRSNTWLKNDCWENAYQEKQKYQKKQQHKRTRITYVLKQEQLDKDPPQEKGFVLNLSNMQKLKTLKVNAPSELPKGNNISPSMNSFGVVLGNLPNLEKLTINLGKFTQFWDDSNVISAINNLMHLSVVISPGGFADDTGMVQLSQCIRGLNILERLEIKIGASCKIEENGMRQLGESLGTLRSLRCLTLHLELTNTELTDTGAASLFSSLSHINSIEQFNLNFGWKYQFGRIQMGLLAQALKQLLCLSKLQLNLRSTHLEDTSTAGGNQSSPVADLLNTLKSLKILKYLTLDIDAVPQISYSSLRNTLLRHNHRLTQLQLLYQ